MRCATAPVLQWLYYVDVNVSECLSSNPSICVFADTRTIPQGLWLPCSIPELGEHMELKATLHQTVSGRLVVRAARLFRTKRRSRKEKGNERTQPEDPRQC